MEADDWAQRATPKGGAAGDPPGDRAPGALKHALLIYAGVTLGCVAILLVGRVMPFLYRFQADAIAALFLLVPTLLINRQGDDFAEYGLVAAPVGRGLLLFAVVALVIFPPFALGSYWFYRVLCARPLGTLPRAYALMCPRFVGGFARVRIRTGRGLLWRIASQLGVIALPEEYFFRGYLQSELARVWPPRRRLFGGGVGVYLVVTSALFALGHLLVGFNPLRLAVFFPSLLFGWMRAATGSILASVLLHAASNVISEIVHRSLGFS